MQETEKDSKNERENAKTAINTNLGCSANYINSEYIPGDMELQSWIKQSKLQEMFQRAKRIIKIQISKKKRQISLKKVAGVIQDERQIPEMDKFAGFWGDICEKDKKKRKMAWIDKVHKQLIISSNNVKEINITENTIVEEIKN